MMKIKQMSVSSLPEHQQDAAMHDVDVAIALYPSVQVDDCSLHIFEMRGEWEVWLNNEDHDFTGLCVSIGTTRDEAIATAVRILEAAVEELQKPVIA